MEKQYPAADLISGWPGKIMVADCLMLVGVVVETPSTFLDSNSTSVALINFNVVEVVVGDATRNILP
jgi:hypothetical protein